MKKSFVLRKAIMGATAMLLLSFSLAGCSNKSAEAPAETAVAEEEKETPAESAPAESEKKEEAPAETAAAESEKEEESSGDASADSIDVDALIKDAEAGDAEAQVRLGFLYYYGEGVEQDFDKAVEWFRKSAEQGQVSCTESTGIVLRQRRRCGAGL